MNKVRSAGIMEIAKLHEVLGKTDLQKSPGKTQKFNTRELSAVQKYLLLSENSIHGKRKTNRIYFKLSIKI